MILIEEFPLLLRTRLRGDFLFTPYAMVCMLREIFAHDSFFSPVYCHEILLG